MTATTAGLDLDRTIPSADDELWYTRCPIPTAFELALATGAFEREFDGSGLSWLPIASSPDPATHQSHFTHRKANSFRHGGNVPAIVARARGADTVVIGVSWTRVPYPVLALPASGIERAADLRGRRLLVPRRDGAAVDFWRASTLRVYAEALRSADLSFDDVELVEVDEPDHVLPNSDHADVRGRLRWALHDKWYFQRAVLGPLVRGEVDAVTSQSTHALELQGLAGARIVFDQAEQPDRIARVNNGVPDTLTVSGALARERPELVARVIARLLEAAAWSREHRDESARLLSHRLQLPTALLEASYGDTLTDALDVALPDDTAAVLQSQHDHLLAHGFIAQPFDVDAWIDPRPLELARELAAGRG
ncbi:ABC transporter substrate-binding protein [Conexibacter arvalis]|uniref:ABC-type nitrate/sulfonate/bicarbonate transport system substrate-binding protein n=1 Tax=Conexibacter arvalis TaxID=912552 RepID=A0A840IDP0_9ACTN|nr:ABC transporter substrate-binding protein [Conexibacter arvalis]MBB4662184.1 ABC-type nitrate/sulfonate/bicarbonate transport system substrate-binding protein [Conexibacter arvalis]